VTVAIPKRNKGEDDLQFITKFVNSDWVKFGQTELLFIKRAANPRDKWSGHVAFPGGKREKGETALENGIREAKEEIGLDLKNESNFIYLGRLDDRATYISQFNLLAISCFIFLQVSAISPTITLQQTEIVDYRWVPIAHFKRADISSPHHVSLDYIFSRMFLGNFIIKLFNIFGVQHIVFPSILLPHTPTPEQEQKEIFEYRLWGLTLSMSAEIFKIAEHADLQIYTTSSFANLLLRNEGAMGGKYNNNRLKIVTLMCVIFLLILLFLIIRYLF